MQFFNIDLVVVQKTIFLFIKANKYNGSYPFSGIL